MSRFIVDAPRSHDERLAFAHLFMQSLVGNAPAGTEWYERIDRRAFGQGDTWITREGDRVVGGLVVFDLGQHWGGRSLPCAAVSAVAVAPDRRGHGIARQFMTHALRHAREQGRPIAALYPATQGLYRKLGFELAGISMMCNVPVRCFDLTSERSSIRPYEPGDFAALRAIYNERAVAHEGWLDRSELFWRHRVFETHSGPALGYVVTTGDRIDGYLFFRQTDGGFKPYDLVATDISARTPAAWAQLGAFIAAHRSMAGSFVFRTGAHQLPLGLLAEVRDVTFDHRLDWMLRILDVERALAERGYHPFVRGEARFAVRDAMIPENDGAWSLRVSDGRGTVERASSADVTLDVRALAALFAGYFSPYDVAMLGLADGDRAALAQLGALFTGRAAGLPDMF